VGVDEGSRVGERAAALALVRTRTGLASMHELDEHVT
jgi:hypothetical protein